MKKRKNIKNDVSLNEGDIYTASDEAIELINLIADNFSNNARFYLVESLILLMRELSFYIEKYFKENINDDMGKDIETVKNIRNAICHRSSEKNWTSNNIKIRGCSIYDNADDFNFQYGENRIRLVGGIIKLYIDFRKIIFNNPSSLYQRHLSRLKKEEQQLTEAINRISTAIVKSELEITGMR